VILILARGMNRGIIVLLALSRVVPVSRNL